MLIRAGTIRGWWLPVICMSSIQSASAHPGGTDRYGCHVESATGIRHCHNGGGDGGSELEVLGTAEVAVEAGVSMWVPTSNSFSGPTEKLGVYASVHLQHDGSMAFMANVDVIRVLAPAALYIDLGAGAAAVHSDIYGSLRVAAGVQVPLYRSIGERGALHLKLGLFLQLIADDVNAEPAGVSGVVGWTF